MTVTIRLSRDLDVKIFHYVSIKTPVKEMNTPIFLLYKEILDIIDVEFAYDGCHLTFESEERMTEFLLKMG